VPPASARSMPLQISVVVHSDLFAEGGQGCLRSERHLRGALDCSQISVFVAVTGCVFAEEQRQDEAGAAGAARGRAGGADCERVGAGGAVC
jgi:hypothetical protein